MEHLQLWTIFWAIKQVSTYFKVSKLFIACFLPSMELNLKSVTKDNYEVHIYLEIKKYSFE